METLVSFVIPAYNCEKSIIRTLDCIKEQTISDYEILVINDGSTDNTLKTVNDYSLCHQEIKMIVLSQNNAGPGMARDKGIQNANGEYILFVDSDDEIPDNYAQKLVDGIHDSDFCYGGYEIIDHSTKKKVLPNKTGNRSAESVLLDFVTFNEHISLWNSIFIRKIIIENNIHFSSRYMSEDVMFISLYLCYCKKAYVLNDVIYTFYYDGSRAFEREIKQSRKNNVEKNIWTNIIPIIQRNKWEIIEQNLLHSRIPVDTTYMILYTAFISQNYSQFILWWKHHKKTIKQQYKTIKRGKLPFHIYIKTKTLSLTSNFSPVFLYLASKKLLKRVY